MKIFDILKKTGIVTHKYPAVPYEMDDRFRGKPEYNYALCIGCAACAIACPPNAITVKWKKDGAEASNSNLAGGVVDNGAGANAGTNSAASAGANAGANAADNATPAAQPTALNYVYDAARCIFCGRCDEVCPTGAIVLGNDFELAVKFDKNALLQTGELAVTHCKTCGKAFKSTRLLAHTGDKLALATLHERDFSQWRDICRECKRDAVVAKMSKNELEVIK